MNFTLWLTSVVAHLRSRGRLVLAITLVAIVVRMGQPAPPPKTVEGVAAMLGKAAGGEVKPDAFLWEERGSFLHDALIGRRVLFLAALPGPSGAAAADVFRARVRLTYAGRPVSVHGLRNLTATPVGHERDLVGRGRYVAFATSAYGAVQGITLLDLGGDYGEREARTRRERLQASVEAWLDTGTPAGFGRTEIAFGAPPPDVKLDVVDGELVMALGPEGLPAALDPQSGALRTGDKDVYLARAQRIPHPVRPMLPVAIEVTRRGLGEAPARAMGAIAGALGPRTSNVSSNVAKAQTGNDTGDRPDPTATVTPPVDGWPPAPIAPQVSPAWPGEGIWAAPASASAPAPASASASAPAPASAPASAPAPAFYQTVLRPDPALPRAAVRLVAMDMRQLELRMEPGFEEPRPTAGPRGSGRLPQGPAAARVAAVFTGGKPQGASEVGMVVDRRILVPPTPGAATIAVERDGRATFGLWPSTSDGSEVPARILSLRQSPLPLVEGGSLAHRTQPGAPGPDRPNATAERAALCVTRTGHMIYAWSAEISAESLAKALVLADCEAGAHLGMSPAKAGFAFVRARDGGGWDAELATPAMSLPEERLTGASPIEIFYLVTRDMRPPAPPAEGAVWTPDTGRQPPPAWLPGVYTATVTTLGAQVRLTSFAPERFAWRIRAGSKEPSHRKGAALPGTLDAPEQERASAAIGLGAARRKGGQTRGMIIGGLPGFPFRSGTGAIVASERGLEILPSSDVPPALVGDAVELPLTADAGKLLPEGRKVGTMRARAAACVLEGGAVLVATTTFDSDEAATEVLLGAGCSRVVALDRGAHHPAFLHRAGTETPPLPRYEPSALYAVEVPMRGRARTTLY